VQNVAGQMELSEYQLDVLGYHDFLYDPDLLAERVWPLIRLRRFDEARGFAAQAMANADPGERSRGLNAYCAIEGEAGRRRAYFDACMQAYKNADARRAQGEQVQVTVHAYNAAMAALAVGRPDEAEKLLLDGARGLEFTTANPWRELLRIYLDGGKLTEAVGALREMQRWRKRQPAYLRDQDRAETEVAFATMLLVAGESNAALKAVDRAMLQPDRRGVTSSNHEQALGAHALLRRALMRVRRERMREDAAAEGWLGTIRGTAMAWLEGFRESPDDERIRSVLADEDRLTATLRLGVRGGMEPMPVWLVGDLVDVLGPGVVSVGLDRAAKFDGSADPRVAAHLSLRAEVALARGDEAVALKFAREALAKLGPGEVLLRGRVLSLAAKAALERGEEATGVSYLEETLRVDGGALRRRGMALPARVESTGGDLAADVAGAIERSPRFESGRGFVVRVTTKPKGVSVCLLSVRGDRLKCVDVEREMRSVEDDGGDAGSKPPPASAKKPKRSEPETDEALAKRAARVFQHRVFAAEVTLSNLDMQSLDGRVSAGSEAARERMEGMLNDLVKKESEAESTGESTP
jgi:tetratricopeptide (TPR) repeat protein